MRVVIIGGVAGGASAATRIRRLDEEAEIIIYEKSGYVSYANCGLPYYIGDVITDEAKLSVQDAAGLLRRYNIWAKVKHEVIKIDPDRKVVKVKNLTNNKEFEQTYDKLVIATGAKPIKPNIPGVDLPEVFTLRNVEDTLAIKQYVNTHNVNNIAIIGGGFIGIELAENLANIGKNITIYEMSAQLLSLLDRDMAAFVHATLREHNVTIKLKTEVSAIEKSANQLIVKTESEVLPFDMVVLAIGVIPDTTLVNNLGINKGIKGSIVVNDKMETEIKDIYAVGDAVQVKHYITGKPTLIPLAGPANKQGRIAADNICGLDAHYNGSQGTSIIKIFDKVITATGLNETMAKRGGYNAESIVLSPISKAGYYPGSKAMTMKITFDKKSHHILGAQIFGMDGVDKRIDVIATAIRAKLKATDLPDLELAYAPPFSLPKDPVNLAGFIIENVLTGKVNQVNYQELMTLPKDGSVTFLDVRSEFEFARGSAEAFINLPLDNLRRKINELPKDKKVIVMCQSGLRSYLATRILKQHGFDAYNFVGGYAFYRAITADKLAAELS
ncbi:MAG: FAD-dependent oxidoreductase [Erysipelotrichaceae bacterium]|nr:FAD-dependent oxidoreductase [Erysipelotrichaceae bacterium]